MEQNVKTEKRMSAETKDLSFQIRKAQASDWEPAMELAFRVFLKYEAMEYGPEGIKSFSEFVSDETLKKLFLQGNYLLFVAVEEENIIGLISLRSGNHISLLFVDSDYHRCGVGTSLIKYLQSYLLMHTRHQKMTVNAAPYGIPFYHKLGFKDTGYETKKDGIIYTPMEFYL